MLRPITLCCSLLTAVLAGCATLPGSSAGDAGAGTSAGTTAALGDRPGGVPSSLDVYLDRMAELAAGDPATQAEALAAIEADAEREPTTTHLLIRALALAIPGHAGSDPAEASRQLEALLDDADTLLPTERALVIIHLNEVERTLGLIDAAERARSDAAARLAQLRAESAARLDAALEENKRLSAELESTTEMLDQLTTIEETIRERDNVSDTP
jgi:hypothetical protein